LSRYGIVFRYPEVDPADPEIICRRRDYFLDPDFLGFI